MTKQVALGQIAVYEKMIDQVKKDKYMPRRLKKELIAEYQDTIRNWKVVAGRFDS